MKNRIIRLTESDVERLVKKIIKETEEEQEVPQGQDNPKDVEKFMELADQYLFNKYGAYAEKIDTTKEKAMIIASLAKKWGVESGDLSKVKSILNTESSLRRKNLINEININDTVKKLKAKGKVEPHEEEKLLDYISKKIDGDIKGSSIEGDDFKLTITNRGFNVNKKSDKKRMFNFDQIGDMVKYIKESRIDEVGGYDAHDIMGQHASTVMVNIKNSVLDLLRETSEFAKFLEQPKKDKNDINEFLGSIIDTIDETIITLDIMLKDFTEDELIAEGRKFINILNKTIVNLKAISGTSIDSTVNVMSHDILHAMEPLSYACRSFINVFSKTDEMFVNRLSGKNRGWYGGELNLN